MGDINPYRLKISQLRALVAIADAGTFSDAALQLELSQSAVSHAIATLEEALGVVLLSRGRQGAALTPLGESVTAQGRQIMQSLATIGQLAQQARGLQQGTVRVAGFRSVATHIMPEVIQQFRVAHPNIQVRIEEFQHFSQVEQEVRHGKADIGFTYLPTTDEFSAWELLHDRYIVLLPSDSDYLEGSHNLARLRQQPLILPPKNDGDRDLIDQFFAAHDQPLEPAYEVREDSTILSMVQQGLGATIMAHLAAEPIPPQLQQVELPRPLERVIGVIQLADALQPPPVYAFIDTLQRVWPLSRQVGAGRS
ncbi:MAG: LysR family transcriptional regulator [Leptolyngbyaceae cyanobacterium]